MAIGASHVGSYVGFIQKYAFGDIKRRLALALLALCGQTKVLQYHFNWEMMFTVAAITWWNFYFRFYRTIIRVQRVIDFLD